MMKIIAKTTPTQTITPVMRTNTKTISVFGFFNLLVSNSKERQNCYYGNVGKENFEKDENKKRFFLNMLCMFYTNLHYIFL